MRRLASCDEGLTRFIRHNSLLLSLHLLDLDPQMGSDAPADHLAQSDRNGVSNHSTQGLEMNGSSVGYEGIGLGEALKNCAFSQRDGSVLLGVSEPTVPETVELGGQGRSGFIPYHPAIDARIGTPRLTPMAVGNEMFWPVSPCSTRSRGANSL